MHAFVGIEAREVQSQMEEAPLILSRVAIQHRRAILRHENSSVVYEEMSLGGNTATHRKWAFGWRRLATTEIPRLGVDELAALVKSNLVPAVGERPRNAARQSVQLHPEESSPINRNSAGAVSVRLQSTG